MVAEILYSNHTEPLAGHLGINKTCNKLSKRFYWLEMQEKWKDS